MDEFNREPSKEIEGAWVVEVIDSDGGVDKIVFMGPNAETMSQDYMGFLAD